MKTKVATRPIRSGQEATSCSPASLDGSAASVMAMTNFDGVGTKRSVGERNYAELFTCVVHDRYVLVRCPHSLKFQPGEIGKEHGVTVEVGSMRITVCHDRLRYQ